MIKSTAKKSWIKPLTICWILIMFFSSGQILAQEVTEYGDQGTKVLAETEALPDAELELVNENSDVTEDSPDNNIPDLLTKEEELTTDEEKSLDESTEVSAASLDVNNLKVNVTQVAENKTHFTVSTVGYAGKTGIGKVVFPTWTEQIGRAHV